MQLNLQYRIKPVLKDLNLSVKAGQKVAIVGATGSGKTTIVNLLTRFYDIDSGEILLDGVNINDIPKSELRGAIGPSCHKKSPAEMCSLRSEGLVPLEGRSAVIAK